MRAKQITGPAGLDMGAAGYCVKGRHLWLCRECRRRCCNGYVLCVDASTATGPLEDMHQHPSFQGTEGRQEAWFWGWSWKPEETTP